jgi:GxxExxY protein
MENFPFKEETYSIIGICMEVHRILGPGFSEIVYKDAIEVESRLKTIPYSREIQYCVEYKEFILKHIFSPDFVMFENIILDAKATDAGITNLFISKMINYLKVSKCKVGLIVNFGKESLEYKRIIL